MRGGLTCILWCDGVMHCGVNHVMGDVMCCAVM